MIRAFFVEFVFPLLLFLFIRSLLGNFLSRYRNPRASRPQSVPTVQEGGELKKDPVCGTYVSTATSLTRTVNGQVVYFCSKACSDRYPKA
ncbi:MAG: hypothetical protein ACLQKA_19860 [Bryobacteraceae bacterium]